MENCKQFANGFYSKLLNVVREIDRDDIQSVEALLIRLTGDMNAGHMLLRLFYWWPKSVKQGWVYKSWRDWDAELCLSRDQVGRVHHNGHLESVGVERVQKLTMKGNPIHYRLDVESFLAALAAFAGVSVEKILIWIHGKPDEAKANTACSESPQAYTTNKPTEINRQNTVVDSIFTIPGMQTPMLLNLINQYGFEQVQAMYEYALRKKANNISGFVRKGLAESWFIEMEVPPQREKSPSWLDDISTADIFYNNDEPLISSDGKPIRSMQAIMEASRQKQAARKPDMHISERIHTEWTNPLFPEQAYTITKIWDMVANQLKLQFGSDFKQDCLRHLSLVDFEPDASCFVLASDAESTFWYTIRCERNFTRLMSDLMGVETTFRVIRKEAWQQMHGIEQLAH